MICVSQHDAIIHAAACSHVYSLTRLLGLAGAFCDEYEALTVQVQAVRIL